MKHALVILAGAALMACTTPTAPPSSGPAVPPADKDTCNAARHAGLIGKPIADPGVPAASRQVRHIRPDSIVTMDFSATRLNINTDDKGMIVSISCG